MLCAKCNTENLPDAVYSAECGTKLELRCPSCTVTNPQGSKFCRKCGTALGYDASTIDRQSVPAPVLVTNASVPENIEGERKTVTVLFADIKGSMDLIEDLDPLMFANRAVTVLRSPQGKDPQSPPLFYGRVPETLCVNILLPIRS